MYQASAVYHTESDTEGFSFYLIRASAVKVSNVAVIV